MNIIEPIARLGQWWPVRALNSYVRFGIHVMFWGFHITIIAVMLFGVLPEVAWPLLVDFRSGRATFEIVAPLLAWMILPVVFVTIAWQRSRNAPWSLLGIFYGIELPLLWGLVLRMFAHEFAGAAYLIIGGIVVGIIAALVHVVFGDRSPWWLQPFLVVLGVCGAIVAAITSMMAAPPLLVLLYDAVEELLFRFELPDFDDLLSGFVMLAPMSVSLLGIALFFFVPLFVFASLTWPLVAPLAWVLIAGAASKRVGTLRGPTTMWVSIAGAATVAIVAIATTWSHQPQLAALAIVDGERTPAALRGILKDESRIRAGLTHAFLGSYRTISDTTHISLGWDEVAERYEGTRWREQHPRWSEQHQQLRTDAQERWASRFEAVAGPFVYHGNYRDDAEKARELYAQLFGEEIERSERVAINHALGTTTMRGDRYAGFMDQGAQRVHLVSQQITSEVKDGVATVEIHDEWQNHKNDEQEVLLAFSLPPSAAVDGLWLGGNANKADAFVGKLSSRGAAQQVYREQVQRRSDPALLEQVGPFQYRLRVFPIPGEPESDETDWLSSKRKAPHVHTWVRYQVPVGDDGSIAMPTLLERRNGFWSGYTKRSVNGQEVDASDDEPWVQATMAKAAAGPIRGVVDGQCWQLAAGATTPSTTTTTRIDVIVDTSYDVGKNQPKLLSAIDALRSSGAQLRFLVANTPFANSQPSLLKPELSLDGVVFIGAASPKVMIRQYLQAAKDSGRPDAIIVLAGRSSFDVADDQPLEMSSLPPTYLVHLHEVPAGYDDATADALSMSGGTVVRSVGDALAAMQPGPLVVEGRVLSMTTTGCAEGPPSPVLTRLVIRDKDRSRNRSDAKTLDVLHGIARAANVVTPYSSLIALVDAEQLKRLAELEGQDDRFQREVEVQTKMMPTNSNSPFDVSGAPEPTTWALLATAAAATAWKKRRRGASAKAS